MNTEDTTTVPLATLVQEQMDGDQEFQTSIGTLSDDEKATAISKKRDELYESHYSTLKSDKEKAEELANNYKTRAEKAENKGNKKPGEGDSPKKDPTDIKLSYKDTLALINEKVHEEDFDDVVEYAQFKKIEISEALKSPTLKAILAEKAEKRNTADATTTKNPRNGTKKPTDAEILERARKGEIPEPGSPEAEALYRARRGGNAH